ncbi:FAD/NAD(P)-binding protein [Patescibacteria group bacterium]|nr:FAD/NAD(P)-binding protein [Patescibacteria group bacterium]
MSKYSHIPRKVKIIKKYILCDDVVGFRLKFTDRKSFSFHPGQFVMLSVLGFGEVPIGITISPKEKGYIEVAVHSVGQVTKKICSMGEGEYLGVSGPFGNGFPLAEIKGKDLVIMSGGLGLAPLRSLIHHLEKTPNLAKSVTILNGARCPERLLYRDEYQHWEKFANLNLTVDTCDSDWDGCTGNLAKLFDRTEIKRGSIIIVCGPPVMFETIVKRYAGKTVAEKDIYFLLERRMKCGVGKCQHCTCGEHYVCLDGPVFSYATIKYEKEAFA